MKHIRPNTNISCYVGSLIRKIRLDNGLSGSDLAKIMNMSQQQISRYECGQTKIQLEILFKLFNALKMNEWEMQYFFKKIVDNSKYSYIS